jgi:hypothetical protein
LRCSRTQAIRPEGRIAWIPDRNHGNGLIALRDVTVFSRLVDSKARHLVGDKPERRSLNDEIFYRHARVMERMAIRRTILELQLRNG